MTIKIVTDSTCDLPKEIIEKHNIIVVPLYINVGSKSYLDGIELTREEFYKNLPNYTPHPTTATPGSDIFQKTYRQLAEDGAKEILSIHISSSLSATLDVARLAAQEVAEIPVTIFDSRHLSMGTGFLVQSAALAAQEGKSLLEITTILEEIILRSHVFAALDTLEYLRRSGRMNGVISGLGSLLQVKPILIMYNGKPSSERVKTRERAINRIIEMLTKLAPFDNVAVLHSNARKEAEAILQQVNHLLPSGDIPFVEITPVIGAHIGPGAIGFACVSSSHAKGWSAQ